MLTLASNLLQHILRELEKSPSRLFRASELKQISISDFNHLVKERLLVYHQYDPNGDFYPCPSRCSATCDRVIGRIRGKWEAICQDGEADTKSIPLSQDDIEKYYFDIDRFAEIIRSDNNLADSLSKLDDRLYFIGFLNIKSKSTAIILALCNNSKTTGILLLSIPSQIARYQAGIVLMPFFDNISQNTRRTLEDRNIYLVNFADAFGQENWVISQEVFSKVTQKEKAISFSKAKKLKIDLTKSVFQYKDKQLIGLRNQTHKILLRILDRVSGKTKDTYISLKDIVLACGWKMDDYKLEPENYKNRISGAISEISKVLKSVGLPEIGRLTEKGYLCSIVLKDIEIVAPTSSGKARPNIKRLEKSINTPSSENE